MVSTQQQATGKKLGSYELLREVCASSVGATFVARAAADASSPQVMLTKVHRHVAKSPQLCDGFLQAAKKAAELTSPTILKVVDSGTADGEIFVAHEHHDGDSLATLLRRAGPDGMPLPIAMRIVLDVLDAIRAAHAATPELGHGELGPWCIHLGADGRARVSGFGVDRALTRFGLHFAKNLDRLPFAAPERVKAMSLTLGPPPPAPDLRADSFSAAVLAWELFTRQRLFASRMEAAVIQKVLASAIPDPKSQRADVSELISRAIVGQLARDPAERNHPDELARAIETSDVATHEAVAEFAASQVDKSQSRAVGTPRAFASVRPPAAAPGGPISVGRPKPPNGGAEPAAAKPADGARRHTAGDTRVARLRTERRGQSGDPRGTEGRSRPHGGAAHARQDADGLRGRASRGAARAATRSSPGAGHRRRGDPGHDPQAACQLLRRPKPKSSSKTSRPPSTPTSSSRPKRRRRR
jgi:hypothetical protein